MAAYDIKKHFSGLRVQTARRRGHNPFATGFEDDSDDDDFRKSRPKTKAPPVSKSVPVTPFVPPTKASPFARARSLSKAATADDDDDNFLLEVQAAKKADRRPSPAPAVLSIAAQRVIDEAARPRRGSLPGVLSDQKKAAVLAAGPLAYLDDSSDDDDWNSGSRPGRRTARNRSPLPRATSASNLRSSTPSGARLAVSQLPPDKAATATAIPLHTVASPFAGTKYLQDSDSDSDEEAVASRKGSAEDIAAIAPDNKKHHEVPRVDKGKLQNGGGVSWRAFSAGRAEQRNAELDALASSLRRRGRSIQFCPVVRTDDGRQISLAPTLERNGPTLGGKRFGQNRAKSPPRRAADTKPILEEDELADREFGGPVGRLEDAGSKTDPFSGEWTA
ncbi:hypothetical protein SMMN14_08549 [Sphaerulina musiva]